MKPLILASSSATRQNLLKQVGWEFTAVPSNYEEDMTLQMEPVELAKYLSLQKAQVVAQKIAEGIVLSADTFGVFKGELMGKPHTAENARQMLHKLSGQWHEMITGFAIIDIKSGQEFNDSCTTKVQFRKLTDSDIDAYIATGEPLDKGASYAILQKGALLVNQTEGDPHNISGLPLSKICPILQSLGAKIF